MNKYTVEFSQKANVQIRNIFSYIAEDSVDIALTMVDTLESRANQLADNPFIGVALSKTGYPFLP